MATENGITIPTRRDYLLGETVRDVEFETDADGVEWCILRFESEKSVYITEDSGWVLVDPQEH